MQELYERINQEVAREARLASARWNNMTEADDIEQELWIWALESPSIQRYLLSANSPQIKSALSQKADAICSSEHRDFDHFSGQYSYTPANVRELLTTYYGSDVSEVGTETMALAEEHLSETMISNILGGTITADEKIDVEQGLLALEETQPQYYEVLFNAYCLGVEPGHHMEKGRAVDKLTTIMNRKRSQRESDRHEGLGTRPKNTNTQEKDY